MANYKYMMGADDVAKELNCSKSHAYKLVKMMNQELAGQGYITIAGMLMPTKTPLQKQLEKQLNEEKKIAQKAQLRERATAIVSGAEFVLGFRVMDQESETVLHDILEQYDGNENNHVSHRIENLPRYLQDSISLQYEKLQMYGMLADVIQYVTGGILVLNETGKSYFQKKQEAVERQYSVKEKVDKDGDEGHKKYDVFISHASKDKIDYVDLLYAAVRRLGINVFYDTDVISWGDNWKKVILDGTANSEFAIIVISKNFFDREWTERELREFLTLQNDGGQKVILPLLFEVSKDELLQHYPELEEIQYISADKFSKEEIAIFLAKELIKRYK